MRTVTTTTPRARGTFDHGVLDDCRTEGLGPAKTHWARPIETPPFFGYPLQTGITFTYLGVEGRRAPPCIADGRPRAESLRRRRDHGRQHSRTGIHGRLRHDHRHRLRSREERRRQGRSRCHRLGSGGHGGSLRRLIAAACSRGRGERAPPADLQCMPLLRRLLRGVPGDGAPARVPNADIMYLANLCHNCGACLYACQYAPPHEFAVNVPRVLAQVRTGPTSITRGRRCSDAFAARLVTSCWRWRRDWGASCWPRADRRALRRADFAKARSTRWCPTAMVAPVRSGLRFRRGWRCGMGVTRFWRDTARGDPARARRR